MCCRGVMSQCLNTQHHYNDLQYISTLVYKRTCVCMGVCMYGCVYVWLRVFACVLYRCGVG